MADRSRDWLAQGERDLRHAGYAREDGDLEWSCFAAQQAAGKAVKALCIALGGERWGHSTTALFSALPASSAPDAALIDAGRRLDKHYIQSRYPNGFDTGAPGEYYALADADEAITDAAAVLAFCRPRPVRSNRPSRGRLGRERS